MASRTSRRTATAEATDRYTLRGGGPETWEPRFTFHGFRYVDVEGWPGELGTSRVDAHGRGGPQRHAPHRVVRVVERPAEPAARQRGLVDARQLRRCARRTARSATSDWGGPATSTPSRRRRRSSTTCGACSARGWRTSPPSRRSSAGCRSPCRRQGSPAGAHPTALWGDVAVSLPVHLYEAYGDREVLARQYESMTAFIDQVGSSARRPRRVEPAASSSATGSILTRRPATPAPRKADAHLVATAFVARTTAELAGAAERARAHRGLGALPGPPRAGAGRLPPRVGDAGRASRRPLGHRPRAGDLLRSLRPRRGGAAGRPPGSRSSSRPATGSRPASPAPPTSPRRSRGPATSTPPTPCCCRRECPSFLYPVTMGATTIWERWDAIRPDGTLHSTGMTSLNHYALGAVADLDAPRGGRPQPGRARLPVDADRARSPAAGSPTPPPPTTRPTGAPARPGSCTPTGASSSRHRSPRAPPPRSSCPSTPTALVEQVGPGDHTVGLRARGPRGAAGRAHLSCYEGEPSRAMICGRSMVVRMPGAAAHTTGTALTARLAV